MKKIIVLMSLFLSFGVYSESKIDREPIKIIVPAGAGGGLDLTARIIGKSLSEIRKIPVIVENKPGANGLIAAKSVLNEPSNGKTLLFYSPHFFTISNLFSDSSKDIFEWNKELTAVSLMPTKSFVLLVGKNSNINNLSDLREKFKNKEITFGSTGVGTPLQIYPEMFFNQLGIKSIHVPYKSYPQIVTEVINGTLDVVVGASLGPQIKSGNLIPLFIFSNKIDSDFPNVPVAREEFSKFSNLRVVVNFLVHKNTESQIKQDLIEDIELATKKSMEELKQKNLINPNEDAVYDEKTMQQIENAWISAVERIRNKK
jgi:tripartite-type tricarboxylate transporter receptor subunit TctC